MRFVNCEVVSEGIEHKEGLSEENKNFEKTINCTLTLILFTCLFLPVLQTKNQRDTKEDY